MKTYLKRKVIVALGMLLVLISLSACSSNAPKQPEDLEPVTETSASEELIEAGKQSTEEDVEEEVEEDVEEGLLENEKEENNEQEESGLIWYMDSEGIKSDLLGIKIKRDSAEWESLGLTGSFYVTSSNTRTDMSFTCMYYDGNIDNFISEHDGMEKGSLGDIIYAVQEPSEYNPYGEVTFVDNGIAFSIDLHEYSLEDIFENGLEIWDEFDEEEWVYIEDQTLYCPALGIKVCEIYDELFNQYTVNVSCSGGEYNDKYEWEGGSIYINGHDIFFDNEENAQNRINQWTKEIEEGNSDWSTIDETIEKNIGKYSFLGKGVSSKQLSSQKWCFASDDTTHLINISFTKGHNLEEYLSVIEELK